MNNGRSDPLLFRLNQKFEYWLSRVRMCDDAVYEKREVLAHQLMKELAWERYVGELLSVERVK